MTEYIRWMYEEAQIAFNSCDYEKAFSTLLMLLEEDSTHSLAQELMIKVQGKREKPAAELRAAEQYFRNNPGTQSAKKLAFTLKGFTRYNAAKEHFKDILKDSPVDTDAMSALGIICTSLEDYEEAIELLEETRYLRPGDSDVLFSLGLCYNQTGRLDDALEIFGSMKLSYGYHAGVNGWLGNTLEKLGRLPEAYACYIEELKKHPAYADGVKFLAEYYGKTGDIKSREEVYEEGIASAKKSAGDISNMANMLVRQRRLTQARDLFNYGLEKELPGGYGKSLLLNNLGVSYLDDESGNKAMEYFQKSLDVFSLNHNSLHNMGLVMKMKSRYGEAEKYLLRALELEPGWHLSLALLGEVYFKSGNPAKGYEYYARAIGRKPKKARYRAEAAHYLYKAAMYKESQEHVIKALELDPVQTDAAVIMVKHCLDNWDTEGALKYAGIIEKDKNYTYQYMLLKKEIKTLTESLAKKRVASLKPYFDGVLSETNVILDAVKAGAKAGEAAERLYRSLEKEKTEGTRFKIYQRAFLGRNAFEIEMENLKQTVFMADIYDTWIILVSFTDSNKESAARAAGRVRDSLKTTAADKEV